MKIMLERIDNAFKIRARNEAGYEVITDASKEIGGSEDGFRPMQLMLASLGSCSVIDVVNLLNKQKLDLKDIKVLVDAVREEGKLPALFTTIHLHYDIFGDLDEAKVRRAIEWSVDKYCSAARILEKTATITWDFTIHK